MGIIVSFQSQTEQPPINHQTKPASQSPNRMNRAYILTIVAVVFALLVINAQTRSIDDSSPFGFYHGSLNEEQPPLLSELESEALQSAGHEHDTKRLWDYNKRLWDYN